MESLHVFSLRRVGFLGIWLVAMLAVPLPSAGQGEGDEDESVGISGNPPGRDVGAALGVGWPPRSKIKRPLIKDDRFHLLEATISEIHRALLTRQITCDRLIRLYFKRIKAYSGHCVKYDTNGDGVSPDYDFYMPSGKGVYLGVVSPIPNAG